MSIIVRNYGTFWERSLVNFGKKGPGNGGSLLGHSAKGTSTVDFCDQRGIYILYEGSDINLHRVTYIGQTGEGNKRLLSRLRDHTDDHLWNRWNRFSWLGLLDVGKKGKLNHSAKVTVGSVGVDITLDQFEASLIQLMEPLLNKQGPKWHGAVEYFQGSM
jgi:hypothetical protein